MSIFVFLGPSLDLAKAKEILPEAHYLPPISCGDILAIMPLMPKRIVIIDGYFENRPAVWHKEILYALSKGVEVYGASSMGALRASELSDFGMIGAGKIYERYFSGEIIDDDEVVLVHGPQQENYSPYTLPLINIRFTVEFALQERVLDAPGAAEFLKISREIFYQERSVETVKSKTNHLKNINLFFDWFILHYIDQKRLDAEQILRLLKKVKDLKPTSFYFADTALFRNLKIESLSKPLPIFADWLSKEYRLNSLARLFGLDYTWSKQLAKAVGVAHDSGFVIVQNKKLEFVEAHHSKLLESQIYVAFLKLSLYKEMTNIHRKSLQIISKIVSLLFEMLKPQISKIDQNGLFEYAQKLYKKHNICSQAAFTEWLQKNEMSLMDFEFAIEILYFYDYFIIRNNLATLFPPSQNDCLNYFSVAISLNGLDRMIINELINQKNKVLEDNEKQLALEGDFYAMRQDFQSAFEMRELLRRLRGSENDLDIFELNS